MSNTVAGLTARYAELLQNSSDTPLLDGQILLCHLLGKTRDWVYAHGDESLSNEQLASLVKLIARRSAGEPIAYITGTRSFWTHEFKVTRDTLVPRPETEILIETVLDLLDETPKTVLDLGTGSGAIAISLAAARSNWHITGVEISKPALAVAQENGAHLSNVHWVQGSWFDDIHEPVDLIISNPPYIAESDKHLGNLVFEPGLALVAGGDGLACIRDIIADCADYLREDGHIIIEHGYDQQASVIQLFEQSGFVKITPLLDLQHLPRAVLAKRELD